MIVLVGNICLPGFAHSLYVFATAEGEIISGYAYSRGGDRIRQQPIVIQAPDGAVLGETTTDDNGEFSFTATQRIDHVVVLETADGHRATFTVPADELPETLAAPEADAEPAQAASEPASESTTQDMPPESERAATGLTSEELEQVVEAAVSRQIRPLREQLEAYESTTRLHDVLGGIGYILGIAGIAFYVLGKKRD